MNDLITIEHAGAKLSVSRDALFQAWMEKNFPAPMIAGTLASFVSPIAPPNPHEGERYAGAILLPNRTGHHLFRMPMETAIKVKWKPAMEYAAEKTGELPDRVESALLFATKTEGEFEPEWYWTRETHAGYDGYAWCQAFNNGYQDYYHKASQCRVVLVRRVPFSY